jgi:hypothetical protein
MARHERKSKAGPDFGYYVDDKLRPVLRNVKDAARVHGCLTVKRDPRPLMAAHAHLALQLWPREGSIHPKHLAPMMVKFRSSPYVDLCAKAERNSRVKIDADTAG